MNKIPLTGTNIVLLIRDGKANDLPSLCRAFGIPPLGGFYVQVKLDPLVDAGLVEVRNRRYEVTRNWRKIASALEISLSKVSRLGPRSIVVEPTIGPPEKLARPPKVFVVMPFL